MTTVNPDISKPEGIDAFEPKHLAFLLDRLSRRLRRDADRLAVELGYAGRFDPLTGSSFRLLSIVPDGGARVTDLARTAGMTKQALGQYVAMLEPLGYVTSTPDPTDKRVRIISRTDLGDQAVRTSNELMAAIEERMAVSRRCPSMGDDPRGHAGAGCRLGCRGLSSPVRWTGSRSR